MADDKLGTADFVMVALSQEVVPPSHPCPVCGKAMKDANSKESKLAGKDFRICSSRACNTKADWASGQVVQVASFECDPVN